MKTDTPIVHVEDVYIQAGKTAQLLCEVLAFPPALVTWTFTPCKIEPRWPTCNRTSINFNVNFFN